MFAVVELPNPRKKVFKVKVSSANLSLFSNSLAVWLPAAVTAMPCSSSATNKAWQSRLTIERGGDIRFRNARAGEMPTRSS